jgi:2-methylcitrate dehydratase PrpD
MAAVPVTAEIAKKAAHLAWNDLPDDLVERTKQCLLDWFAVTVAGAQEELPQRDDVALDRCAHQWRRQPCARL